MKIKFIILGIFTSAEIFLSSQVEAIGLGGYATGAYNYYNWEYFEYGSDYRSEQDYFKTQSHGYKFGSGFILDTAIARDKLFNYRLQAGIAKFKFYNKNNVPDIEGTEYHMYHSFGFGIARNENLRIWFGPQVGFAILNGQFDSKTSWENDNNDFLSGAISGGVILGVNINFGTISTLAFDCGFRYPSFQAADGRIGDRKWDDISGDGYETFLDICFLFRINDSYTSNSDFNKTE